MPANLPANGPAQAADADLLELPLVLLSHRAPVSFGRDRGGRTLARGSGGLVTALTGLAGQLRDAVWVCAAGSAEDVAAVRERGGRPVEVAMAPELREVADGERADGPSLHILPVGVPEDQHDRFYGQIANPLLWFLQHGLYGLADAPDITTVEHDAFRHGYVPVNELFAQRVVDEVAAREGNALVMVHDYHFYLVPELVRRASPEVLISHFVHIPWPGPDSWRVLPPVMRDPVLWGLLGSDVVAFHTRRSARNFLLCAQELLNLAVDWRRMTVRIYDREVAARFYPISIDVGELETIARTPEVAEHAGVLRRRYLRPGDAPPDRKLLLRVDRTDPSKNIVRGFRAFDTMLSDHPALAGRVVFLALLQPSRQDVPEYAEYLNKIGAVVAEVNARHGRDDWQPVDLRLVNDFPLAVAAYQVCDVLLVNALADGMNLVAKEVTVLNQRDTALALSENTGAFEELGDFAVTIYPFDVQQSADALYEALSASRDERRPRLHKAAEVVRTNDVGRWLRTQLADIEALRRGQLDAPPPGHG